MPSVIGRKRFTTLLLAAAMAGVLMSCATHPAQTEYAQQRDAIEARQVPAPEYLAYTVKGLPSVQCDNGVCSMTEADFRQNQHDKRALLDLYKLSHEKDTLRVQAYNTTLEEIAHLRTALAHRENALQLSEQALQRERTVNNIKTWVERLLFIGGAWVFGNL